MQTRNSGSYFQSFSNSRKDDHGTEPMLFLKKVGESAKLARADRETEKVLMSQRDKAYEGLKAENDRLKLAVLESQQQENRARQEQSRKKGSHGREGRE